MAGIVAGLLIGSPDDSDDMRVNAVGPAARAPPADAPAVTAPPHHLSLADAAAIERQASNAASGTVSALLDSIQTRLDGPGRLEAMTILYRRFAELDPRAAFDHAMANGMALGSPWSSFWVDAIFREWARQDLQAAIAHAGQLRGNDVALTSILAARPDLPDAQQAVIIRQLTFGEPPPTAGSIAAMAEDPGAALEQLDPARHEARRAAAGMWIMRDGRAAMEALDSMPDWASRRLARDMIGLWASRAPDDAMTWALNRDAGDRRTTYVAAALNGMATTDPARAATMAAGLASPDARQTAISSVLAAWVDQDPPGALAWFEGITDPETRRQASATIAARYGRQDPDAAVRWAVSLPTGEADAALSRILSWMARDGDPEAALEHARQITDPRIRLHATSTTVSQWARSDPQAAYAWAGAQTDAEVRGRATDVVVFAWGMTDPDSLNRMLNDIVDEAEYQRVARTAWRFLGQADLERLLARVSDEALAAQIAEHLQRTLGWTDPARAERMAEADDGRP